MLKLFKGAVLDILVRMGPRELIWFLAWRKNMKKLFGESDDESDASSAQA